MLSSEITVALDQPAAVRLAYIISVSVSHSPSVESCQTTCTFPAPSTATLG
ncbi:MAG: hypothetical protein ACTSR3_06210 [Candidatus Helarchaeota archaeon]